MTSISLFRIGSEHCLSVLKSFEQHLIRRRAIDKRLRQKFLNAFQKAQKVSTDKNAEGMVWKVAFERGDELCQSLRSHRLSKSFKELERFDTLERIKSCIAELDLPSEGEKIKTGREVANSYFDEAWYLTVYPDVALAKADPFSHFYDLGWKEGRNPHAHFNTQYYLEQNPDVKSSGLNPFEHFVTVGWREGRSPHLDIQLSQFRTTNPLMWHLSACPSLNWMKAQQAKTHVSTKPSSEGAPTISEMRNSFEPEKAPIGLEQNLIKVIAFYEQEIESTRKNSKNWSSLVQRRPCFANHQQPRVPGALGFYDQRVPETLEAQIELAKKYHVGAFCFRIDAAQDWMQLTCPLAFMQRDADRFDFPFLVALQVHSNTQPDGLPSVERWKEKIEELRPLLQDSRYLRYKGRPVIVLDGAEAIPELPKVILQWRAYAYQHDLGDLFILWVENKERVNLLPSYLDAAIHSPQLTASSRKLNKEIRLLQHAKNIDLLDYSDLVKEAREPQYRYPRFDTVLPAWDESGSAKRGAKVFVGSDPDTYTNWLFECSVDAYLDPLNENNWVFVNAWNDWLHSAHLEPDAAFCHDYLDATNNAICAATQCIQTGLKPVNVSSSKVAVVIHVESPEGLQPIFDALKVFRDALSLEPLFLLTSPIEKYSDIVRKLKEHAMHAVVIPVKKLGGDARPFFFALDYLKKVQCEYVLKLTHPSLHEDKFEKFWRTVWLRELFGTKELIQSVLHQFEQNPKVGAMVSQYEESSAWAINPQHRKLLEKLLAGLGGASLKPEVASPLTSGMFWFRRSALDSLDSYVFLSEFKDDATALGLEQVFPHLITHVMMHQGFEFYNTQGDPLELTSSH